MTQQLYPSKKGCNKCGGQISWDIPTREYKRTKLPLNLDGSIHDRESCESVIAEHPGLPVATATATTSTSSTQDARTKAIEQAHQDNMDASERLRQSIDNLSQVVDRFTIVFGEMVKTYLDGPNQK